MVSLFSSCFSLYIFRASDFLDSSDLAAVLLRVFF